MTYDLEDFPLTKPSESLNERENNFFSVQGIRTLESSAFLLAKIRITNHMCDEPFPLRVEEVFALTLKWT